jgi:hypothetical protein
MAIEQVRYELPFHELMPPHIRKLLAAFYTRPQAAELLARLTINDSNAITLDPACGSGTILTSPYRQKKRLHEQAHFLANPHARYADIRFYDLYEMLLFRPPEFRPALATVFKKYSRIDFPAFRLQLDQCFDERYVQFWESQKVGPQQTFLWDVLNQPISASATRLEFDLEICEVLRVSLATTQLLNLYRVMISEIIILRRLGTE